MISLGVFFIFGVVKVGGGGGGGGWGGQKGKNLPKMKNNNYIHHTSYLKNTISYNHDFWYTSVKWWYLQAFFFLFLFLNFYFLGCKGGKSEKSLPKLKNNNYIRHTPYLRNSIVYDHGFWYTCIKWWYLQLFFSFFW